MPTFLNQQNTKKVRLKFIAVAAVSALLLLLALVLFEILAQERHHQNQVSEVTRELSEVRASLEFTINKNLNLARGLSSYISLNPNLNQQEFSVFTSQLLHSDHQISHFGAAKDLVVSHIFPMAGNEAALGLEYSKNPIQRKAAFKAIKIDKVIMAGPLPLVQGNIGLIARTPVREHSSGKVWGLLSVVLDYQKVLSASGVNIIDGLELAIRGKDSTGAEGEFFYGNSDISKQNPVTLLINFPYGNWQLLATPKNGWDAHHLHSPAWAGALILLILWIFLLRHRYTSELLYLDSMQHIVESEKKFRNTFHEHNAVMLLIDQANGQIVDANASALHFYGFDYDTLTNKSIQEINILSEAEIKHEMHKAAMQNQNYFVFPHQLSDGSIRFVEVHSTPIKSDDKTLLFSIIHDITSRIESEQKLKLDAKVFEHSQEGVLVTDANNRIVTVNRAFTDITGYQQDDVEGDGPAILKSGRHDKDFYLDMYNTIKDQGFWKGEIWNRKKDGTIYPQLLSISKVENDHQILTHYVAVFSDITRLKQSEARMEHLAHYDALTNLPNRLLLKSRFEHALERAKRQPDEKVGVLFMDLDHFKVVNDSLGHMLGDELLRQVARRLKACVREDDTIARLGGDEFVILLEGVKQLSDLSTIAQNIIEEIKRPYFLKENHKLTDPQTIHDSQETDYSQEIRSPKETYEAVIGTSIGITVYPDDSDDIEKLFTFADTAMYKAKHNGRNTYAFYTESITQKADQRFKLSSQLSKAIEQNELELFYQPQIDMTSLKIIGAEALIRWNHPKEGLLAPFAFIEIAEETGIIHEISKWVIAQGCRQLKKWQDKGHQLNLALNISPRDFRYDDFYDQVKLNIQSSGINPQNLELELTENGLMETNGNIRELLLQLKSLNISLAVDDFGTGHSSIAYLKHFPVDKLKIDRSFIKDIDKDDADMMITETIIDMAKNFNLKVVAEGVETENQQNLLNKLNCDIVQGYFYSKPLPLKQFENLLEK